MLGPGLHQALTTRGYQTLTPVQQQVLGSELQNRDLRISSQTGSGKTLAIGFALRGMLEGAEAGATSGARGEKSAKPLGLVIVPTRELAKQVELELSWLYRELGVRIASVTGGASYREEHRALGRGPALVVGTPGRLLDHLERGVIDTSRLGAVVLDEADQMLDLGFRDELDRILELMPGERRTHLVSATFAHDVKALADRIQKQPKRIEGTPLGSANADIDHIVHLAEPDQRLAALINVLLYHPHEQTLIFARTRNEVAEVARELLAAGFAAGALSGEMDQAARNGALAAFKQGRLRALVATDVAARGIDVQNIARVVHLDAPQNAEIYTHRAGRTGRAGRKGTSVILITRALLRRSQRVLSALGVKYRVEPVPSAQAIAEAQDLGFIKSLEQPGPLDIPARVKRQVERIVAAGHTETALAMLVSELIRTQGEPRQVTQVAASTERGPGPRGNWGGASSQQSQQAKRPGPRGGARQGWVSFHVSCGKVHGADARRLVAMLCRRGSIKGRDLGAIRIGPTFSEVEVASEVAASFAEAARRPDPRNPRVNVLPRMERAERSPLSPGKPRGFGTNPKPWPSKRQHAAGGFKARPALDQ